MTTGVLELRRVSKTYLDGADEVHALRDVDLTVEPGRMVAVMGPSGSGKSTLLTIAGALETPTAGEVLVGGHPLGPMSRDDRARLRRRAIGYVFQDFNLLAGLTASENVALPLILGGLSQVKGKFMDFAITINNDEKDITKSTVSVVIKATSINTGIEGRDRHLRTADFFDVEKFPEITFKSEHIEKKGKQFIAHGPLTMHGVTKPIALPFTVTGTYKNPTNNKISVGYSARLVLNRRDFGINYAHRDNPTFVGDNITVEIELVTRALDPK